MIKQIQRASGLAILWWQAVAAVLMASALLPGTALAEEGGSGHYLPGSMASFVDAVPLTKAFVLRLNALSYDGDIAKDLSIPIAGSTAAGVRAKSDALGLTALWRPSWGGNGDWSYGMSATVPYLRMDVSGSVASGPVSVQRSDAVSGLGDLVLIPLMLNYKVNPDFNTEFRLVFYAPTGSYELGRLANTGKNFWTVEPTVAWRYFGQKNGIEATLFAGIDYNRENAATQYKSGNQFHLDGTLAQHFPFAGGLSGAGLSGFYYQQLTGDSGAGASFGDFKAQTIGIGPVLSYVGKWGGNDIVAELKWLHETETEKRLQGDTVFFKFIYRFF